MRPWALTELLSCGSQQSRVGGDGEVTGRVSRWKRQEMFLLFGGKLCVTALRVHHFSLQSNYSWFHLTTRLCPPHCRNDCNVQPPRELGLEEWESGGVRAGGSESRGTGSPKCVNLNFIPSYLNLKLSTEFEETDDFVLKYCIKFNSLQYK